MSANEKVRLVCSECGRRWSVSPNAADPRCPKCDGVDWDVDDDDDDTEVDGASEPRVCIDCNRTIHTGSPDDCRCQDEE